MTITAYLDCRVDSHNHIILLLFLLAICIATPGECCWGPSSCMLGAINLARIKNNSCPWKAGTYSLPPASMQCQSRPAPITTSHGIAEAEFVFEFLS